MNRIFHSFYARLSAIFLLLVCSLGAGCIFIAFNFTGHLFDEVEQLLNRGYAKSIAEEIQPFVTEGFNINRIKSAIHYMMVLNPMVEIYVVADSGKILAYFTHPAEKIVRNTIDLEPLNEFVKDDGTRLILGEDPRSTNQRKPFSAAPLKIGNDTGYIYIILRGQGYDQSFAALRNSYYLQAALFAFLLAVAATLIAGFSLFFLLTRRIRSLSVAVKAFEKGNFYHRIPASGNDEIGSLGHAFNEMASAIEENVEKLRFSELMRRELVANISHDLRSPLTSIRGYLETILMKDAQLTPEKRKEFLTIVLRNVSGFQKLVQELFDLVMLETKQVQPEYEPFQIRDLAQDVMLKLKPQAAAAEINLTLQSPEDIPLLSADIGMIERVLTNLLENAIHFTPRSGSVSLKLACDGHKTEVSVTDTGRGIAPHDLPHIFERYFHTNKGKPAVSQAARASSASSLSNSSIPDQPSTSVHSSTGLGLAIARQIIELHGSLLKVESTVGKGTRFYFYLTNL